MSMYECLRPLEHPEDLHTSHREAPVNFKLQVLYLLGNSVNYWNVHTDTFFVCFQALWDLQLYLGLLLSWFITQAFSKTWESPWHMKHAHPQNILRGEQMETLSIQRRPTVWCNDIIVNAPLLLSIYQSALQTLHFSSVDRTVGQSSATCQPAGQCRHMQHPGYCFPEDEIKVRAACPTASRPSRTALMGPYQRKIHGRWVGNRYMTHTWMVSFKLQ